MPTITTYGDQDVNGGSGMWYPRADPPLSTGKPGVQHWISRTGSDVSQYAPAAERNAGPILAALRQYLPQAGTILEIGSGTGQHAIAFATAHPELIWQPSDPDPAARASISAWATLGNLANVCAPLDIDVTAEDWTHVLASPLQGVVCINLLHIAPWAACTGLMAGAGALLEPGAPLYLLRAVQAGRPAHRTEQRPVRPLSARLRSDLGRA
jgi:Protein of unknown function (DUF938)